MKSKLLPLNLSVLLVLTACSLFSSIPSAGEPTGNTTQATAVPPTPTREPASPTPTPLPGKIVVPVDQLADGIPWLPWQDSAIPTTSILGFNTRLAPFDRVEVRQAFAMAIDKKALLDLVITIFQDYSHIGSFKIATTYTPPDILGRDLTGEVGIVFNAEEARNRLKAAGYDDPSTFPAFTFRVSYGGSVHPEASERIAEAIIQMWETNLGINNANLEADTEDFLGGLLDDPAEVFLITWFPDVLDPDDFMNQTFFSSNQDIAYYNFTGFDDPDYQALVQEAARVTDPATRQALYIEAERYLCEEAVPLVPLHFFLTNP